MDKRFDLKEAFAFDREDRRELRLCEQRELEHDSHFLLEQRKEVRDDE
jgi:hypothetical protein